MRIGIKKDADDKQPPEEKALEAKIDAMMEPARNADRTTKSVPDQAAKVEPPPAIDIFKDPVTAPAVPKDLLKKIGATKAEVEPPVEVATSAAPEIADKAIDEPNLDDDLTDKAVDEIASQDSDELLAQQDAANAKAANPPAHKTTAKQKLINLLSNKWTWIIIALLLIAIFAVPYSRYKVLGLVIKQPLTITVLDSKTNTPVSNADISLSGVRAKTDANGQAKLRAPVGPDNLVISKQYYTTTIQKAFVGFRTSGPVAVKLVATGRQVPVKVLNSITGKPLAGVTISVLSTTAKTDINGLATIVLPTKQTSDKGNISAGGYNSQSATINVLPTLSPLNTFNLTPSGQVYFLSNLSGKIDVVKTNLDCTNRQTVLAGTGTEDPNTTSLLASRDWNFVVLKAQRNSSQAALYLINTADDKITQFDSGNVNFDLIGWYGHNFIYDSTANNTNYWQTGHQTVKSYNADQGILNQLDQNQAEGVSGNYAYQQLGNFYLIDNDLTYTTQWYGFNVNGSYDLSGKNDTVRLVQPGGQSKKDYQSWPTSQVTGMEAVLYQPQSVYYSLYDGNNNQTTYYVLQNQTVASSSISQTDFNKAYPTFLISPSGAQTFWSELRDGKNTLLVGDKNAQNPQQLATLSDYSPYGWFSDSYLLVSKNSSELYIIPASGLPSGQQPLKITDYYKPATTYRGYGYGYGGL